MQWLWGYLAMLRGDKCSHCRGLGKHAQRCLRYNCSGTVAKSSLSGLRFSQSSFVIVSAKRDLWVSLKVE